MKEEGGEEMDIVAKKSKSVTEIFPEISDDKEFQKMKVSVSIETQADISFLSETDGYTGESVRKNSASEEAEEEYYRRLREAIGNIGIELFKDLEKF